MKRLLILISIVLISICFNCKKQEEKEVEKISSQHTNSYNQIVSPSCLLKSDSLEVKKLVHEIIRNIETDKADKLSSKIKFPLSMFNFRFNNEKDFIEQWNKSNELKNYLSLEIYDEDDEFVGKSDSFNTKIIFSNSNKNEKCFKVQFGIGSGLIFTLDKINEKIKIVNFDTAG